LDILSRLGTEAKTSSNLLGSLLKTVLSQPHQLLLFADNSLELLEEGVSELRSQLSAIDEAILSIKGEQTRTRNEIPQGGSHEKSVITPSESTD
jgi:hypothetical protein